MQGCCLLRKDGYDKTGPGRLGDLLDHWSARRLKEAGADCVKILLYYTPFDPKEINDQKHAWVERLGDECRANDIPFFLEFVVYEEAWTRRVRLLQEKPKAVIESMRESPKTLWRRRDEGRSPDQYEIRGRDEIVQGRKGVLEAGSDEVFP